MSFAEGACIGAPAVTAYQALFCNGGISNKTNWFDTLRFANWMHNGRPTGAQGAGTTEGGAYTLTGVTIVAVGSDPTHGANGRNAGATVQIHGLDQFGLLRPH